ncbi:MAG: mandelate racemase/muconate lactonizing enzyme family protein [Dehalococcoidia bacterium]|nr:mandelate racemase/muconate lactonizing enzyme family protein [Dehalococcoidia bacterium]MDW8120234.1 mandelate racemase/muconate lactonizing enzyme family protein [Chloroflexota bacterium]
MKITAVKSFPVRAQRHFFFVKVETDEGIYGVGEAGVPYWAGSLEQAVRRLTEELLLGEDPFSTERLWQRMFRAGFFPADKVVCAALSAIDIALWDIKGKALGLPVYKLLGGPVRDKVVCYPHNAETDTESLLASCRRTVAEGWKFVRWGLPHYPDGVLEPSASVRMAVQQVAAVRETVGDEIEICLDVHTRLDTAYAIRLCRELEPFRPFFVEDPLRSENPASYRTLARHVAVPIAAGEQWAGKWAFREVIEEELIQYARIDLCIVGGITEALKVTHWCETHYIDIVPHNPLGPVSSAAAAHLCLASTNVGVLELPVKPGTFLPDVFPVQIPWEDGYVLKPERPGLGLEFNEEACLAYARAYTPGYPPRLRRRDGAFTNW